MKIFKKWKDMTREELIKEVKFWILTYLLTLSSIIITLIIMMVI